MDEQVFLMGNANGLQFEFQPLQEGPEGVQELAWGRLRAWVGEVLVWSQAAEGEDPRPVNWTWVELLDGLARIWPWLLMEEGYPIPISPEHPGKLEQEARARWQQLSEGEAEAEEDILFDFRQRHDLALLPRGIYLPSLWLLREGRDCLIWSDQVGQPLRQSLEVVVNCLTELANTLAAQLKHATDARATQAVARWQQRHESLRQRFFMLASGLEADELRALAQVDRLDTEALVQFFDVSLPMDETTGSIADTGSEMLAAARMTLGYLDITSQRTVLSYLRDVPKQETPTLDALSRTAPDVAVLYRNGYEQGYALVHWLREELTLTDGAVDPEALLLGWGVMIVEKEFDPQLDALAVWGQRHGPGIILNSHAESRAASINGRRTTLAHELCHLLIDRSRSLPIAEVLGGQAPRLAEQRANAFAAELLLARDTAADACRHHADLLDAASELEKQYRVSREVVRNQINNSRFRDVMNRMDRQRLAKWAGRHVKSEPA